MKKVFSSLIILIGLSILLYPKGVEIYQDHRQKAIMKELESNISKKQENILNNNSNHKEEKTTEVLIPILSEDEKNDAENNSENNVEDKSNNINENTMSNDQNSESDDDKQNRQNESEHKKSEIDLKAESVLIIDKINFKQPILKGATQENLSISAATVNKDIKPGDIGNYAIAGHRSRTYGRNFNRLDELQLKDKIKVVDSNTEHIYVITDKFTVKPEEVWVLEGNNTDREVTLITCHPMVDNPTHRLIIKGKIIE